MPPSLAAAVQGEPSPALTVTAPPLRRSAAFRRRRRHPPSAAPPRPRAQEGFLGLWKGNMATVLRVFPNKAILLGCYDIYGEAVVRIWGDVPWRGGVSGALAGATSVLFTYPLDLARSRIAGEIGAANLGLLATMRGVVKEEGLAGLYRGITPTFWGSLPYEAVKFGTFDYMQRRRPAQWSGRGEVLLWGCFSGAVGATLAHLLLMPNEVVRRRMQAKGSPYRSAMECFTDVARRDGVRGLYTGLFLTIFRGVPNTAMQMGTYELLKSLLGIKTVSSHVKKPAR